MSRFPRKKRVTDPLDEEARARFVGAGHRQLSPGDGDSLSLSYLVLGFFEDDSKIGNDSEGDELDQDRVDSVKYCVDSADDSLSVVLANNVDPYKNMLLAHVSEALEKFAILRERNVSVFRRSVAAFLRERGHDAAVCETAGDSSGGSHEFIDVVQTGSTTWRYFIDLDFRAQFEIARPTRRFSEVLCSVPCVFVGEAEELKRSVSILCDAAKRCFRSRGLTVPPWRKNRFMQNKWFGPCRRTVNSVMTAVTAVNGVSCRLVGFDDVVFDSRREGGVVVRAR
ncbi:hypothetical protein RJT34_16052 [Clitoria ternatea]|uniref:Uncharacterized protein n=1 Tax=Clitoria ternatea TaxID=43366 RepID=A0AAN9J7N3_CLITE